jgi:hypothetical protein
MGCQSHFSFNGWHGTTCGAAPLYDQAERLADDVRERMNADVAIDPAELFHYECRARGRAARAAGRPCSPRSSTCRALPTGSVSDNCHTTDGLCAEAVIRLIGQLSDQVTRQISEAHAGRDEDSGPDVGRTLVILND